ATTCFAVGDNGAILATINGGTTWNLQSSGTTQELNDISCPTTNTCFAVGGNDSYSAGLILATTNGGSSWTTFTSAPQPLIGVNCPSPTTCFAVGGNGFAGTEGFRQLYFRLTAHLPDAVFRLLPGGSVVIDAHN